MLELYAFKHYTNGINRRQRCRESRGNMHGRPTSGVAKIQLLDFCSSLHSRGGAWIPLNDVSSGECTKQVTSVEDEKGLLSPYAFALTLSHQVTQHRFRTLDIVAAWTGVDHGRAIVFVTGLTKSGNTHEGSRPDCSGKSYIRRVCP